MSTVEVVISYANGDVVVTMLLFNVTGLLTPLIVRVGLVKSTR